MEFLQKTFSSNGVMYFDIGPIFTRARVPTIITASYYYRYYYYYVFFNTFRDKIKRENIY